MGRATHLADEDLVAHRRAELLLNVERRRPLVLGLLRRDAVRVSCAREEARQLVSRRRKRRCRTDRSFRIPAPPS